AEMDDIRRDMRQYGVGPSNREAQVELGGKGLTEEEFEQVKGDRVKINKLLQKKLGITEALPEAIDPAILSDMHKLNQQIFTGMETVTLPAEAFLQTGGNEKAIRQKQDLNKELKKKPAEGAAEAPDAWQQKVEDFASTYVNWCDFGEIEDIAKRLGVEPRDVAGQSGLRPADFAAGFAGCTSVEDLYKKL